MKTEWMWLDGKTAAFIASNKDEITEGLRDGYGFLDLSTFVERLENGSIKIIAFQNRTAALIELVETKDGLMLNILTVAGNLKECDKAIEWLERAAMELNVHTIISIGHTGWKEIVERHGYYTEPKLLMRKKIK